MWGATGYLPLKDIIKIISIHAPVWGATFKLLKEKENYLDFNSRSRVGSDWKIESSKLHYRLFQFTLPCGERLNKDNNKIFILAISIHAPVWGATNGKITSYKARGYFNSRSRVGSDLES